jgi:outer membrane protein OmpA-like peptidoglycan-associated protein
MNSLVVLALCVATAVVASGCATKKFVREQVGMTENALTYRVDTTQSELRQTADKTGANTQAIEAANQKIETANQKIETVDTRVAGVDTRVNEVSALAADAKREAGTVGQALRETDEKQTQRFNNRNKYTQLDMKSVYFDFNKATLRDEGMSELEEVARALKADPNAVVELQGFADTRGSDDYNYRLTRDRVDAVIRYLVQRHGIELRRVSAVGMGKASLPNGGKADRETLAKSRRVDIVLLAPQS